MALIYLSLAWVGGIFLGSRFNPPLALLMSGLVPLPILLIHHHFKTVILTSLCLVVFFSGAIYYQASLPPDDQSHLRYYNDGDVVSIKGVVIQDPDVRDKTTRLKLSASAIKISGEWLATEGTALLYVPRYPAYDYGDVLQVSGELKTPTNFADFDYQAYLARQGVYSTMLYPEIEVVASERGFQPLEWIYTLRHKLAQMLAQVLPEPQASLAQGMILGLRGDIPDSVNEDFARSGTTHLLAISGMNLIIVAGILSAFVTWLIGKRHYLYVWLTLGAIWFYAIICGASPSVIRAAIMASLFLLAELLGRQRNAAPALCLAAVIMQALNPQVLWDISFQLSFIAMAGLIFLYPAIGEAGRRVAKSIGGRHKPLISMLNFVMDSLAITLAATLAVWPVVAAYFGMVSLAAPLATLLAIPAMTVIIVLGALSAMVGLAYLPLAQIIGWALWLFLSYFLWVAHVFARLPGAVLETGTVSIVLMLTYYAAVILIFWWLKRRKRSRLMAEMALD